MKLLNTDIDTLFFSGQVQPLTVIGGKGLNQVGLTVTLGDYVSWVLPNKFSISDGQSGGGVLVVLNLTKTDFILKDNYVLPTLERTKKKSKDHQSLLVTGTLWTNMSGNPNVDGIILAQDRDINVVQVLAVGLGTSTNKEDKNMNALLSVPTDAYYLLDGQYYKVSDDSPVKEKPAGVYFSIRDIVEKSIYSRI